MDKEGLFPGSKFSSSGEKKKEPMKPRLRKIDRRQMILHPVEIELLIPLDHEVRALWEFLGSLDLTSYHDHIESKEGKAGAPAFDPRLLACIWLYSYSKGINSAREVAKLTEYHPAYQWLTGIRPVNYHTLADFRSSYGKALSDLYAQTLAVLSYEGLITMERVMHDGTKIKSFAGKKSFRSEKTLKKFLSEAKAQVKAMEASEEEMGLRRKKARERAARERKERLSHALQELKKVIPRKKDKEERVSLADPECRIMKQPGGGLDLSYNLQLSTDAQEKAIVALSLSSSPNDQTLLEHAMEVMEETTGLPDQLLVDKGFTSRANILTADEKGIDLIGPMRESSAGREGSLHARGITEEFNPDKFLFDPERDVLICPKGKFLSYRQKQVQTGKIVYYYLGKKCSTCSSKPLCCPKAKRGRIVCRLKNDPKITAFLEKMNTPHAKALYKQRAEVAEFPNLWIKEKFGLRRFRLKGLVKAEMEARWACLTYNIKLWIRLCWKPRLEAKMG